MPYVYLEGMTVQVFPCNSIKRLLANIRDVVSSIAEAFVMKVLAYSHVFVTIRSPQKVWNILETINFWSYLRSGCIVLHTTFLQCHSFVPITVFSAQILPLEGGGVRKEMCQI